MAEGRIFRSGDPHSLVNDEEVRRLYLGERFSL
jgi:ABC-type lipopolysaccharide export system ATPase subunit